MTPEKDTETDAKGRKQEFKQVAGEAMVEVGSMDREELAETHKDLLSNPPTVGVWKGMALSLSLAAVGFYGYVMLSGFGEYVFLAWGLFWLMDPVRWLLKVVTIVGGNAIRMVIGE